ncbi:MAG: HAD hydrolase-like protein, partial [Rickettsiales bacterium]|jgi:ribonucleotide monophosphatase NagD (HAD superfamily)|nr:HAD hydrolase-like protein [Rickettsiales bacterium]
LPIVCANPDFRFLSNGEFVVAQGLVCKIMEQRGARVIWFGKPDEGVFLSAMEKLGYPDPDRAVMIGDTLRTDILGATRAGIKSCLTLARGITTRDLTMAGKELTEENIIAAAAEIGARVDYIIEKVPAGDL